jgi:hypothetical protein
MRSEVILIVFPFMFLSESNAANKVPTYLSTEYCTYSQYFGEVDKPFANYYGYSRYRLSYR